MPATQSLPNEVQAQLGARIDAIGLRLAHAPIGELAQELATLRRAAQQHRIGPALTVLQALDSALARGERGPLVQGWLTVLRDAVGCDRRDLHADRLFAAACTVRLAH